MTSPYIFLGLAILFNIVGNHCFKATAINIESAANEMYLFGALGFGSYFASAFFYIIALRNIPLSSAYPSLALTYPITIILASIFFGEQVTLTKVTGSLIIVTGVYLISR